MPEDAAGIGGNGGTAEGGGVTGLNAGVVSGCAYTITSITVRGGEGGVGGIGGNAGASGNIAGSTGATAGAGGTGGSGGIVYMGGLVAENTGVITSSTVIGSLTASNKGGAIGGAGGVGGDGTSGTGGHNGGIGGCRRRRRSKWRCVSGRIGWFGREHLKFK